MTETETKPKSIARIETLEIVSRRLSWLCFKLRDEVKTFKKETRALRKRVNNLEKLHEEPQSSKPS